MNNDNNEQLFWRVWRNDIIRTSILTSITSQILYLDLLDEYTGNRIRFQDIVSVEWMLEKRLYEIFKDKLKSNNKLYHRTLIFNRESIQLIFKNITDQDTFTLLYEKKLDIIQSWIDIALESIKFNNINSLISYYNFICNNNNTKNNRIKFSKLSNALLMNMAIENGSIEIVEFLRTNVNIQIPTSNAIQLGCKTSNRNEMVGYLIDKGKISISQVSKKCKTDEKPKPDDVFFLDPELVTLLDKYEYINYSEIIPNSINGNNYMIQFSPVDPFYKRKDIRPYLKLFDRVKNLDRSQCPPQYNQLLNRDGKITHKERELLLDIFISKIILSEKNNQLISAQARVRFLWDYHQLKKIPVTQFSLEYDKIFNTDDRKSQSLNDFYLLLTQYSYYQSKFKFFMAIYEKIHESRLQPIDQFFRYEKIGFSETTKQEEQINGFKEVAQYIKKKNSDPCPFLLEICDKIFREYIQSESSIESITELFNSYPQLVPIDFLKYAEKIVTE
eukprot:gene7610-9359_t